MCTWRHLQVVYCTMTYNSEKLEIRNLVAETAVNGRLRGTKTLRKTVYLQNSVKESKFRTGLLIKKYNRYLK